MRYDLFPYDGQNCGGGDFHFLKNGRDENRLLERHHAPFTLMSHADFHGGRLGVYLKRLMAPRERFELPRHEDSGFRIHRDTGLCDLGCGPSTLAFDISLTSLNIEA